MKHLFWLSFFCTTLLIANELKGKGYPHWDISPDIGPNAPIEGPMAGQGQSIYVVQDISIEGSNSSWVWQWNFGNGWQLLGGCPGIGAIASQGNYIYVVGSFNSVFDTRGNILANAHDIAKYNTLTHHWSAIGNDDLDQSFLGAGVYSMIVDNFGNIYLGLGGDYPQLLLEWNQTDWVEVGQGFSENGGPGENEGDGGILALATDGTNVFAAGGFVAVTNDYGSVLTANCVVKWDARNGLFEQMGGSFANETGYLPFDFLLDSGFSMAVAGTNVFLTGNFQYSTETTTTYGMVRYSSISGAVLPSPNLYQVGQGQSGYQPGTGGGFFTCVADAGNFYLSGNFSYVGYDTSDLLSANGIAMWTNDGTANGAWMSLSSGLTTSQGAGNNWYGYMGADANAVFVGSPIVGQNYAGGISIPNDYPIARWMTSKDIYVEVDTNFVPNAEPIQDVAVQNDDTVVPLEWGSASGQQGYYGGPYEAVCRINPDGSEDTDFDSNFASMTVTNLITDLYCVAVDSDDRVYVGGDQGSPSLVNGELIRVTSSGNLDDAPAISGQFVFNTGPNQINTIAGGGNEISVGDGPSDVLFGGNFGYPIGGFPLVSNVAAVAISDNSTYDGNWDTSDPYSGVGAVWTWGVMSILQTEGGGSQGTIVGGGLSSSYGDNGIMNADYPAPISSYTSANTFSGGVDFTVAAMAMQGDGDFVVGGDFTTMGGDPSGSHSYLGRFNADGTVDETFNPSVGGYVNSLLVQSNGKVLIGEGLNLDGGYIQGGLYRFNSDGSLDTNFNIQVSSGPSSVFANGPSVNKIILQADGEYLVAGEFSVTDKMGQVHTNLVRLIDHP